MVERVLLVGAVVGGVNVDLDRVSAKAEKDKGREEEDERHVEQQVEVKERPGRGFTNSLFGI